jgi:hypothetical protein
MYGGQHQHGNDDARDQAKGQNGFFHTRVSSSGLEKLEAQSTFGASGCRHTFE